MFGLIKQVFIALLSFSGSSATRYVSLNTEPYLIRPTPIDLNLVELNYYPFLITLDKCSGSCNSLDDLSTKICIPSEPKDINVIVFIMIATKNKAKAIVKHISCDWKCKLDSSICISNP